MWTDSLGLKFQSCLIKLSKGIRDAVTCFHADAEYLIL